jgi:hypothetical protein
VLDDLLDEAVGAAGGARGVDVLADERRVLVRELGRAALGGIEPALHALELGLERAERAGRCRWRRLGRGRERRRRRGRRGRLHGRRRLAGGGDLALDVLEALGPVRVEVRVAERPGVLAVHGVVRVLDLQCTVSAVPPGVCGRCTL